MNTTKTGSIITGTAATIVESISPFIAMTGIGIPIAFALYTCSIGLKMSEDNKDLAANIKECKEFLLQWLIMCNNNLVVYDKYKNLAIPYYEEKIKEEEGKNNEESNTKIKIYQWKIVYIQKMLNEMLEAGEAFTEVMLGLSYYIEECVNYKITTGHLKNWVISSKVKSGVIQHLIGRLNARFEYFNEVTKYTKEQCHFCITLNDTDVLEKMNIEQKGGDGLSSLWKKTTGVVKQKKDDLSSILKTSKAKFHEKIPTTETLQNFATNAKEKTNNATEKATNFAKNAKEKATDKVDKATTLIKRGMDIFIQGFKELINNLNTKYQELRSKWQEYRENDVLFQSLKSGIIKKKDDIKGKINSAREKFEDFINGDDQFILADLITKTILNAQFNQSYKQLNEAIDKSDAKDFERRKEEFKTNLKIAKYNYNDEPELEPSAEMKKEITNIKTQKKGIFTRIYESLSGKSAGGLSTRRKRKRRPKFHQVRSYKQRPKQQHKLK